MSEQLARRKLKMERDQLTNLIAMREQIQIYINSTVVKINELKKSALKNDWDLNV